MEEKILYPLYPVSRIFYDRDYEIHSLAKVLATWGYTIRSIDQYFDCFEVRCYTGDSSGRTGGCILRIPRDPNCEKCWKPIDLLIKYKIGEEGSLSSPVGIATISVFEYMAHIKFEEGLNADGFE